MKELADRYFANARTIILVQDNLNIHSKASLYEAFPAAEARRLVERFEWHYTPKHGSWLDLAESELGVLTSQCLDRRIADNQTLVEEIAAGARPQHQPHQGRLAIASTTMAGHAELGSPRPMPSIVTIRAPGTVRATSRHDAVAPDVGRHHSSARDPHIHVDAGLGGADVHLVRMRHLKLCPPMGAGTPPQLKANPS